MLFLGTEVFIFPKMLGKRRDRSSSSSSEKKEKKEGGLLPMLPDRFSVLDARGYQVIPGVVPVEDTSRAARGFDDWLVGLGTGIDLKDPRTWKGQAWPYNLHGIITYPDISHEQFVWDIRQHPGVHEVFTELWGTSDLVTSFDRACIMKPPERAGWTSMKSWLHIDQGHAKKGRHCVQGFVPVVDMSSVDGTLMVLENSHIYHEEFFAAHPGVAKGDWCKLTDKHIEWYLRRPGVKKVRVSAKAGDLVLWDSRTVHCNVPPEKGRLEPRWRKVVYACQMPLKLCSEQDRNKRRQAFEQKRATNHWPVGVTLFPEKPRLYPGMKLDQFTREKPQPVLTELGKKLAGLV